VAGRDIGLFVGCFTMTATWVGGGYINGTAEYVYTPGQGLLMTHAPWGYALSLIAGGIFFAKQMRSRGYVTMLDPIQRKLGENMGALLYIPALFAELFWSAAILSALGGSLRVIIGLDHKTAVIVSAAIAVMYTLIGGLYSVAYTDVVQLICIFIGLWLCIPFAMMNEAVESIEDTAEREDTNWIGKWDYSYTGGWIDTAFLLIFGGIPWQVYFQRVLSAKTARQAQLLSFVAAAGCMFMAIPAVLIGAIGASTDWSQTTYKTDGNSTKVNATDASNILPLVMHHLTPTAVSVIGLGAVSAAVMSSADSSILSVSSLFTHNIYKKIFRQNKAGEKEMLWVLRVVIVAMGVLAAVFAIIIQSVYTLWFLCSDLTYVILFPQLVATFYFEPNTYGSLLAYFLGAILRFGGGVDEFGFKSFIHYPGNDENNYNFPYKTFAMVISLITTLVVSWLFRWLFESGIIPSEYDVFQCNLANGGRSIDEKPTSDIPMDKLEGEPSTSGMSNEAFEPPAYEEKTAM